MYCKNCGFKIGKDDKECKNCGEAIVTGEFCGGFWDMVRTAPKKENGEASTEVLDADENKPGINASKENVTPDANRSSGRLIIPAALLLSGAIVFLGIALSQGKPFLFDNSELSAGINIENKNDEIYELGTDNDACIRMTFNDDAVVYSATGTDAEMLAEAYYDDEALGRKYMDMKQKQDESILRNYPEDRRRKATPNDAKKEGEDTP
ncbi:MAG: zinc ribbon domain-containing protein [Eubacterium sp.]|nr:zinc ribbon domain-containing protein [Eubacterium sp.]